ncbi:MAG: hypothetical protein ACRDDZ_01215 [Marinifilaceae bacterium]
MASSNESVGKTLKTKVEQLITLYRTALATNHHLQEQINDLEGKVELLQTEKESLQQELKAVRTAGALRGTESSDVAKRRISQLVREIDKCIALLSNEI